MASTGTDCWRQRQVCYPIPIRCVAASNKSIFLSHPAPQFLETLFDVARPNLRINGPTTEEPSEVEEDNNVEPKFDEASISVSRSEERRVGKECA